MSHAAEARPLDGSVVGVEEWGALPEDQEGELVDGRIEEEEVPSYLHEVVVAWLIWTLRSWLVRHRGLIAGSDAKFATRPGCGRKPDISVYLPGGATPPALGVISVPPDIAVEVVSPTPRDAQRDRVEKLADYAAFGVRWYWIVDPQLRTFELLELGADGRYVHALAAAAGRRTDIPGCPGLVVDLDDLWAEADALENPSTATGPG